jgi:hypothetical protein
VLQRAASNNVDIAKLIKKGYTMSQITDALQNAYKGSKHRGEFSFKISGKPQQQNDLKSIHQAVETPGSGIANYGKRTIGALRQAHSQKVMQSPELQQQVTPYQLAPEYQPQPVQRRRAAKNIDDVLGFKDWVEALEKQF